MGYKGKQWSVVQVTCKAMHITTIALLSEQYKHNYYAQVLYERCLLSLHPFCLLGFWEASSQSPCASEWNRFRVTNSQPSGPAAI